MIEYPKEIVVVAGPTASGKSSVGLKLAQKLNGYIINGDSRQLYKKVNIGTAKPKFDKEISRGVHKLNGIYHYLYDFVDPKENFTLFDYQKEVQSVLDEAEGIAILVGGTGLYIDSVVFNYHLTENSNEKDNNLKKKNLKELQELAKEYLTDMSPSDRRNKHRLIRAIQRQEVNRKKGKPLNYKYFVVDLPKEELERRVKKRMKKMFEKGLLEENFSLLNQGYTYQDKGLKSIGYIEFKEYFEGEISLEEVKEKIFRNSMKYIKRQKTWFRRNDNTIWEGDSEKIVQEASNFILNE